MEFAWAVLEPSRAVTGRSWGPLGPFWGDLGGLLGNLERCDGPESEYCKNMRFPQGIWRFRPLGTVLRGLLGLSWAFWGPFWVVLRLS